MTSPAALPWIWFSDHLLDYWPMTYSAFWLQYRIWGESPLGYHLTSIVLHATNTLLIFRILRRLDITAAWLASALFAVHPVNVATVAFIAQQKTLLACRFSALCILRFLDYQEHHRIRDYAYSMLFCLLSQLSKTTAFALPPTMLVISIYKNRKISRSLILELMPFFAVACACASLALFFKQIHPSWETPRVAQMDAILAAFRAAWFYLWKSFVPTSLYLCYSPDPIDTSSPWTYLPGLAALVALAMLCAACLRSGYPQWVLFAVVFFFLQLAPALYFKAYLRFWQFEVADYYLYPAVLGPMILLSALLLTALSSRPRLLRAAAAFLVLALALLSGRRSALFGNEQRLWEHELTAYPDSPIAHHSLAIILSSRGDLAPAMKHYAAAIKGHPGPEPLCDRAMALALAGEYEAALKDYTAAIRIDPARSSSYKDRATVLGLLNRYDLALQDYDKAIELDPEFFEAYLERAAIYLRLMRLDEASRDCQQAALIRYDDSAEALYSQIQAAKLQARP